MENDKKTLKLIINLDAALASFQISVQHRIDFLTIASAGAAAVSERDYGKREFFSFFTAPNHRQSLESAREEFRSWCVMNSFKETIDHLSGFLEESRTALALARLGPRFKGRDLTRVNVHERAAFNSLGLPEKIARLRRDFHVSSKLEAHIVSLNRLRNCLVHRLGIVAPKDAGKGGSLSVKWRAMELVAKGEETAQEVVVHPDVPLREASTLHMRFIDRERQFPLGEKVRLGAAEHHQMMFTFSMFALEISQQVKIRAIPDTHA